MAETSSPFPFAPADSSEAIQLPQIVHIEAFNKWVTQDGQSFASEAEVLDHLNESKIAGTVGQIISDLEAEGHFVTAPKPARKKRDGTIVAAVASAPLTGNALKSAKTRVEKLARKIVAAYLR